MVVVALLGVIVAPLLNLIIDRLPRRVPVLARPTCLTCGAPRHYSALLPVAGWLSARGRCERCGARLARRSLLVELALPLIGMALWLRYGTLTRSLVLLVLAAYFIAIIAIDLEHRLVLNRMTGAGLLAACGIALMGLGPTLQAALVGAAVGFIFLWIPALLLPGLGMGDVKLAAVIGGLVGFPAVFTALSLGVVIGGVSAALLLVSRRIDRRATMAYAPHLVIGVTLVLVGLVR